MGASVTVDIELITEDILPLQSAALGIHTLSPLSPLSRLQLSSHNSWKSGGRPQLTVYLRRLPVNTVIHTTLVGLEPTTFRLLVRRATSSATDSPDSYAGCLQI